MHCEHCHVEVLSGQEFCPLCRARIADTPGKNPYYPAYGPEQPRPYRFWLRFFTFISIVAAVVCGLINLITGGYAWALIVLISIAFSWIFFYFTYKHKVWLRAIINYALWISALLGMIDILDQSGMWSLNYAIPFVLMAATLVITIVMVARPLRLDDYIIYQISIASFGLVLVILAVTGAVNPQWPSYACALYDGLTLLGMLIFRGRDTKMEFKKRFHI